MKKVEFEDIRKVLSFWAYLLAHFFELLYKAELLRTVIEMLLETIRGRSHQFDYNGANELKNISAPELLRINITFSLI